MVVFMSFILRGKLGKLWLTFKLRSLNYLDFLLKSQLPPPGSNFPYWESILNDNKCGISTNPLSPKDISNSILKLLSSSDIVKMGGNGQKTILEKYNWGIEEKKLFKVYNEILSV